MPRDVNDLADVGGEINFDGLPIHDVIREHAQRNWFEGVIGKEQNFARMENVELRVRGEIVGMPEFELRAIAIGELDSGADKVTLDRAGVLATEIAAPG